MRLRSDRLACLLLLLGLSADALAQVVTVTAGRALGDQVSGGTLSANFGKLQARTSIGIADNEIVAGAFVEDRLTRRWALTAGDQVFSLGLPTEEDYRLQLFARGGGVTYRSDRTTIRLFGGLTGGGVGSSFVRILRSDDPIGFLSMERNVGEKKRCLLFVRSVFSNRQTAIVGTRCALGSLENRICRRNWKQPAASRRTASVFEGPVVPA